MRHALESELAPKHQAEIARAIDLVRQDADSKARTVATELETLRAGARKASEREAELMRQSRQLEQDRAEMDLAVEKRLQAERARLTEVARRDTEERVALARREETVQKEREVGALRSELDRARERETVIVEQERMLAERERAVGEVVDQRVRAESKRLRSEAEQAARAALGQQITEAEERRIRDAADAKRRLDEAAKREGELIAAQREQEEGARLLRLDMERRALETSRAISEAADRRVEETIAHEREQARLERIEREQVTERLKLTIETLKQQAHVRSQEAVGEAQEIALRERLESAFPGDEIDDVARGANGADLLQTVHDANGRRAASIIWESKRTRAWSDSWLEKLRDDQRDAGAAVAVIVTQALPAGVRHFDFRDGVWICEWSCAVALAGALRSGVCDVAAARSANEGRSEKQELVYAYLTGDGFKNRIGGIMEAFNELQHGLAQEKRATLAAWSRRQRQHERALLQVTGLYGDVRGYAGTAVPDVAELSFEETPLLGDGTDDDAPDSDVRGAGDSVDARLVHVLEQVLPSIGESAGNMTLEATFAEHALVKLGVEVGPQEYVACREVLLGAGKIRKGRGRGGSVVRVA